MPPKPLTICVPVHNGAEKLGATLTALRALDRRFCDIHILDNRSRDATVAVAHEFARHADNIHIHRHGRNVGQPGNFNRCPAFADGPYFAWLGAGDAPLSGYYEEAVAYLGRTPGCALCYSNDLARDDLPAYDGHDWPQRVSMFLPRPPLGNMNFGVLRSNVARNLQPWRYLLGNDHILQLNILLYGTIHKLRQRLFRRDWPLERSFRSYLSTCTGARPADCPYVTTSFRSLDMLWGYIELAKTFFRLAPRQRSILLRLIHERFYLPHKRIIDERLSIARQRLSAMVRDGRMRLLAAQLDSLEAFVARDGGRGV